MSKPNKDGWIRHRGGKCPVDGDAKVDYRMRDGEIDCFGRDAGRLAWSHNSDIGDIMAYRIHKPTEQPAHVAAAAVQIGINAAGAGRLTTIADVKARFTTDGPLQWRDRITEIDRTVEALEEERVALVQRLEGEGFRLIERINAGIADSMQAHEDMSGWRNWKVGDFVESVIDEDEDIEKGGKYKLWRDTECASIYIVDAAGDRRNRFPYDYKFHSRPSK